MSQTKVEQQTMKQIRLMQQAFYLFQTRRDRLVRKLDSLNEADKASLAANYGYEVPDSLDGIDVLVHDLLA